MPKSTENRYLTAKESERLGNLLWERRNFISRVLTKLLSINFAYLKDDCMNEIFLIACQHGAELLEHPNIDGWLYLTAKNVVHTALRKNAEEIEALPLSWVAELPADENPYEEAVWNDWVRQEIPKRLLSRLTARELEVYNCLYVKKLSVAETAAALGITQDTVRSTRRNFVDKIRSDIEQHRF